MQMDAKFRFALSEREGGGWHSIMEKVESRCEGVSMESSPKCFGVLDMCFLLMKRYNSLVFCMAIY